MSGLRVVLLVILSLASLAIPAIPSAIAQETIHYASTWGGPLNELGQAVTTDSLGNIYVTGYTYSFVAGPPDVFLLKYNASGSLVWQRTWGGGGVDFGIGVTAGPSGHVYVTGYSTGIGAGSDDVILLEYDSDGNIVRQQTWGGTEADRAYDIAIASDGSVYVVGQTNSFGSGTTFDVLVMKFDSTGGPVWQKTWGGGTKNDYAFGTGLDASGNLYVAGQTNSTGTGAYETLLLKFDSAGTLLWQRSWGGSGGDFLWDVAVDLSGAAYFVGGTGSFGAGASDAVILRLDSNGNLAWEKTWGSAVGEAAYGVATDKGGSVFLSGSALGGVGGSDAFLLKLSSNGILSYQRRWGGGNDDFSSEVTVDLNGNAIMVGTIGEAAPYTLSTPAFSLDTPGFTLGTPSFSTSTPSGILGSVSGTVSSPSGSTSYGGGSDSFIFSYGLPNIELTITTNQTTLQAGQTATVTVRAISQGSALAGVTVTLSSPGGTFNPASGTTNSTGYFVTTFTPSSVTSQTTITITATASKANYNDAIPATASIIATPPALLSPELTFVVIGLGVAAVAAIAIFLLFRRKKRPLPASTPSA